MTVTHCNRETIEARDIATDTATLEQRIEAYRDKQPAPNPELIVDPATPQMSREGHVPEITAAELTVERLRAEIMEHGALLVHDLFPKEALEDLPGVIDDVLEAMEAPREVKRKTVSHYYHPASNMASIMPGKEMELANLRVFNHRVGGAMCAEAPSVAEALLEFYETYGIRSLVRDYLGEETCLSVKKWMLRRSTLPVSDSGWHQDGAFMGTDINSINLWLPLTDCGGTTGAPGMDLVPQRLYNIASAEGASFDWSVSDSHVNDAFQAAKPVAPVFRVGDGFFFDHLYLHRTQYREDFSRLRYAIETWFFGASAFPDDHAPLAW